MEIGKPEKVETDVPRPKPLRIPIPERVPEREKVPVRPGKPEKRLEIYEIDYHCPMCGREIEEYGEGYHMEFHCPEHGRLG